MPPSTWSQVSRPCLSISARARADLRQAQVEERLAAEARLDGHDQHHVELGAAGPRRARSASPASAPCSRGRPGARISRASRTGAAAASTWKVTLPAPASTYAGAWRSASSIIRCASSGTLGCCAPAPRPSSARRSGWARSGCPSRPRAPSRRSGIRATSAPRSAKSAFRMLGVIWMPTRGDPRAAVSRRTPGAGRRQAPARRRLAPRGRSAPRPSTEPVQCRSRPPAAETAPGPGRAVEQAPQRRRSPGTAWRPPSSDGEQPLVERS